MDRQHTLLDAATTKWIDDQAAQGILITDRESHHSDLESLAGNSLWEKRSEYHRP
jgi:hypothetical protein